MPLIHSGSQSAISQNIKTEMAAKKPQKQAVAIALDIARRARRADGGPVHVGPIYSAVGGRTDHLAMQVPSGSYVIPADIVSGLGEGNTNKGLQVLERVFPSTPHRARGGNVPIMAAGGEFVIPPDAVTKIGGGDMDRGHKILDKFVLGTRKKIVNTMRKLPGPAK